MRLVDEMEKMEASARPKYVFVENVVGFETSRMRTCCERLCRCSTCKSSF